MSLTTEFREFVLRGNVVDLAVGVVIGASFGAVVTALTKDIITPLIGIFGNSQKAQFESLKFTVHGSEFPYGDFINAVISFLLLAAVVFFLVVKPMNWLNSRVKSAPPAPETTRECPYCLSKIPVAASRCAFCTQEVPAGAAAA